MDSTVHPQTLNYRFVPFDAVLIKEERYLCVYPENKINLSEYAVNIHNSTKMAKLHFDSTPPFSLQVHFQCFL